MVSFSLSKSRSSSFSASSSLSGQLPDHSQPASPSRSISTSASSSTHSITLNDQDDVTLTANRLPLKLNSEKSRDSEEIQALAVSTRITEISYSISDIQTRIFEIQELRHKSQSSGDASNASSVIDQSLVALDERLESVSQGIKSINESIDILSRQSEPDKTPTSVDEKPSENALVLRKHANMVAEWEAVEKEVQVLREELKEDKWLTVFRTVTEQADGMMSSLEKAVNRCQEFMWQTQRKFGPEESMSRSTSTSSLRSDTAPPGIEVFNSLLESFEAKKKHYMPATTKVLSIIDKGVQDRVTKNGECLRRHAESMQRWHNLRERIARTDVEMENVRRILLGGEMTPSEAGSSTSGQTSWSKDGFLQTPQNGSRSNAHRTPQSAGAISRSISPFRKLARKFTGGGSKSPTKGTPTPVAPLKPLPRTPSSEPTRTLRHRSSMFGFGAKQVAIPTTPTHKHTQSLTPESSPSSKTLETLKSRPAWNSSTKVNPDDRSLTVKGSGSRRPSGSSPYRLSDDIPPVPALETPSKRSLSRSSMASSRPWSPVTSSVSTAHSSSLALSSMYRPPSRAKTPGMMMTPSSSRRPKTPSHIPAPSGHWRSMSTSPSDSGWDESLSRAFSPSGRMTPSGLPPRPPSRSRIPIPSVQISSASRPSSSMSHYRSDSALSFHTSALRAQTPDGLGFARTTPRPSVLQGRLPPSSFRNQSAPTTPVSTSGTRPPSRSHSYGPDDGPVHVYVPGNPKDPLDAEVAAIVNSLPHGLLVERVDPPARSAPREGEEVRAQYAFSNAIARKVVTCKLTTLTRSGAKGRDVVKKVMCRVGGGWQDLQVYVMSRQAQ